MVAIYIFRENIFFWRHRQWYSRTVTCWKIYPTLKSQPWILQNN